MQRDRIETIEFLAPEQAVLLPYADTSSRLPVQIAPFFFLQILLSFLKSLLLIESRLKVCFILSVKSAISENNAADGYVFDDEACGINNQMPCLS